MAKRSPAVAVARHTASESAHAQAGIFAAPVVGQRPLFAKPHAATGIGMAAASGKQAARAGSPDKAVLWQYELPSDSKGFGQFQRRSHLQHMRRSDGQRAWPEQLGNIEAWTWFRYKTADTTGTNRLQGLGILLLKDAVGFRKALYASTSVSPSYTGSRVKNWALAYEKDHGQLPFYILPGVQHVYTDTSDGTAPLVVSYTDLLPEKAPMGRLQRWADLQPNQHAWVETEEAWVVEVFLKNKTDPTTLFHGRYEPINKGCVPVFDSI